MQAHMTDALPQPGLTKHTHPSAHATVQPCADTAWKASRCVRPLAAQPHHGQSTCTMQACVHRHFLPRAQRMDTETGTHLGQHTAEPEKLRHRRRQDGV